MICRSSTWTRSRLASPSWLQRPFFLQWKFGSDRAFPSRDLHLQCITLFHPETPKKNRRWTIKFSLKLPHKNPPRQANTHLGIQCSAVERKAIPCFFLVFVDMFVGGGGGFVENFRDWSLEPLGDVWMRVLQIFAWFLGWWLADDDFWTTLSWWTTGVLGRMNLWSPLPTKITWTFSQPHESLKQDWIHRPEWINVSYYAAVSYSPLSYATLSYATLSYATLSYATLKCAQLRCSQLL